MTPIIDKINKLKPVEFNYIDDNVEDKYNNLGFIAHEVQEIFPYNYLVCGDKNDIEYYCTICNEEKSECNCICKNNTIQQPKYQQLDYGLLTPICIKGIQELSIENKKLKEENYVLNIKYESLLTRLIKIETLIIPK